MNARLDPIKIIRANPVIAAISAIAIGILLAYVIFFFPRMKEARDKYLECRMCESQVMDARNLIDASSKLEKKVGGRVLISEQEAASGIDDFTEHGKSLGIKFLSIKPADIIKPEGMPYKILPIEMEIEATGDQFVKFMGSIDELKKAIVIAKSFDIMPDKDNRGLLKVAIVIDLYLSLKEQHAE